jgi:hypothetical protein
MVSGACRFGAGKPIGNGKNAAQIVRGVAPLGGQPGVVEVEPANHGADVERSLHRIELKSRAGHLGAVGTMVPGTMGPSSLVQAGYSSASSPQPSVSMRQLRAVV